MIGLATADKIRLAGLLYRVVSWMRRAAGARSDVVVAVRSGLTWRLDLSEGIDLSTYLFGRFERPVGRMIARHLRPGMIALDIGANVGAHALPMAARVAPSGHVFAVEPTDWGHRRLVVNRRLNAHLEPILTPVRAAIGSRTDTAFHASWNVARQSEVHAVHRGALRSARHARRLTLDELVGELNLPRLDFIKLDVDGRECDVLAGGEHTLAHLRPILVFEFCPYALEEHGGDGRRLLEMLARHGYTFQDSRGRTRDPADLLRMVPRSGSVNVTGIP